jgi:glycosyltransferase involved in cell wall biosynthesis
VKNVTGLIGAFLNVVARRGGGASLIVVGDGTERAACEQLRAHHPYGRLVHLVGEQSDTRPFLSAADVFVLNSQNEGTPRALLEAMSTGLPAICPAIGGIPERLHGRGCITRAGDPACFEAALEQVLAEPGELAALGARCREYVVAHFDAARVFEQYRGLLLG